MQISIDLNSLNNFHKSVSCKFKFLDLIFIRKSVCDLKQIKNTKEKSQE